MLTLDIFIRYSLVASLVLINPLSGAVILGCVAQIRSYQLGRTPEGIIRFMFLLGGCILGIGILVEFLLLGSSLVVMASGDPDTLARVVTSLAWAALMLLFAASGAILIAAALPLSKPVGEIDGEKVNNRLNQLRFVAWINVLLPLTLIGATFVLLPMLFAPAVLLIWTNQRRARQGGLLWLIAIAAEKHLPLPEEIENYAESLWGLPRRKTFELAERLREGISLPEALEQLPGLVPEFAVLAARNGAEAGRLGTALREAAVHHMKSVNQTSGTSSISWFLIYYGSIFSISFSIVAFLMYYIIPKFKAIFEGFGSELPGITVTLIGLADFVARFSILFVPLLSIPVALMVAVAYGYWRGWANLKSPWMTQWFPRTDTPWILRYLCGRVTAKQTLLEGLATLSLHHHRQHIRRRIDRVELDVASGRNCWESLRKHGLLKSRESALLQAAEGVGNLPWALHELAASIERRQRHRVLYVVEWVQPVIIITLGVWVAFFCIGMFMPLVKMLNDLS